MLQQFGRCAVAVCTCGCPLLALALLKLLALGRQDIDAGRTRPVAEVVQRLRQKHTRKSEPAG